MSDKSWSQFFSAYDAHLCPACNYAGKSHCIHQSLYRMYPGRAATARSAPSAVRDSIRDRLWSWVCAGVHNAATESELAAALGNATCDAYDDNAACTRTIREIMTQRARGVDGAYDRRV
jgi:hypothetical protein